MLRNFKKFIAKEKLFEVNDKVLLAVSGGMDSVVMSYLFDAVGLNFGIAHCNFKLRGKASNDDESFVKQLAKQYNVPFHSTKFETEKIAGEQKKSIQVVSRKLRYEWFEKISKSHNYQFIATAHHQNDSIETVLYNFTKGCGIRGLHGIRSKQRNIIRPLLFTTRKEIEQFAKIEKIVYREDNSNTSDKYMRNRIRQQVIPVLQSINPSFEKSAIETIGRINETEAVFDWALDQLREKAIEVREDLIYINFNELPEEGKATVLFEFLKPFGFNSDQCKQILFDHHPQSGSIYFSESHRATVDRSVLVINKIETELAIDYYIEKDESLFYTQHKSFNFNVLSDIPSTFTESKNVAFFDYDKLVFPLKLRRWEPGDIFHPLGMKGKKQKLQDFFTHQKLSIPEKEKIWIMESDSKICWIVGFRIDERFKITKQTKKCYKVEVKTR